jgi:cytoskeleton protein RodZ
VPAAADAKAPTLRLRATAETWVQVRDVQQRVVLEKILQAGGVLETSAARPLSVVVGKASATQAEIDGVAFDLAAVARNNVARFEVK